jgi:hypothetical protein
MMATPTLDQAPEGDDLGEDDVVSDDLAENGTVASGLLVQSTPLPSYESSSPVPDDTPSPPEEHVPVVSSSLDHASAQEESSVSPVESAERTDRLPPEQS